MEGATSERKFDYLIFIGRFQPFHKGHEFIIKKALAISSHVIILCGSAYRPRTTRNPWNYIERENMIRGCFSAEENHNIVVEPMMDVSYDDQLWVSNVKKKVTQILSKSHVTVKQNDALKVGLIGYMKDESSFYLDLFPEWDFIPVENFHNINSTEIREEWFVKNEPLSIMSNSLPQFIIQYLKDFHQTDDFDYIVSEYKFLNEYCEKALLHSDSVNTVTVNVVLRQLDCVLLEKKMVPPGLGLLSLPGGNVEKSERLLTAAFRIIQSVLEDNVSDQFLRESLKLKDVFDNPRRSELDRVISHVFYFSIPCSDKGARNSRTVNYRQYHWVDFEKLDPTQMYQDHYFILKKLLGIK